MNKEMIRPSEERRQYLKPEIMAMVVNSEHLLITVSTPLGTEDSEYYMLGEEEYFY